MKTSVFSLDVECKHQRMIPSKSYCMYKAIYSLDITPTCVVVVIKEKINNCNSFYFTSYGSASAILLFLLSCVFFNGHLINIIKLVLA